MWINLAELAGKKGERPAGFASDEQYFSRAFRKIVGVTPKGPVFRRTQLDENGNIVALAEDEILEPADFTVIAASQGPKSKLINTTEGLEGTEKGLLKVDAEGRTTVPGVFAAGDVVHGGRTVVEAVAGAKITAQVMEEYMMRKGNGQ